MECSVSDMMTDDLNYVLEDDEVKDVAQKMGEWQVHRLPVLDNDKQLVGVVSLGDLVLEADDREATAQAAEGIVQPIGTHEQ
jgi:Mg/Co/Ni transporter MgtE